MLPDAVKSSRERAPFGAARARRAGARARAAVMAAPESSAAQLTSELAALRARQAALLPVLRHRNQTDQSLIDNVDAVFARVPEYIAKLAEVQHSMDMLAARTANMRRKCEHLISGDL